MVRFAALLGAFLTLATLRVATAGIARAASSPASVGPIDAKIEIVWPHDQQGNPAPVATAPLVNVEVYLFQRGTLDPVPCNFAGTPRLHYALNWEIYGQGHGVGGVVEPDEIVGQGLDNQFLSKTPQGPAEQQITRTVNGKTFPVWVFNNVPIGPSGPYITDVTTYFFLDVPGYDVRSNVWAHGADPRTFQPGQTIPLRTATGPVSSVESIIQIVWPHDAQGNQEPVNRASLANVSVDLFRYPLCLSGAPGPGSCDLSVAANFSPAPRLFEALNDGYLNPVSQPAQEVQTSTEGTSVTWPRWNFNDVDVSAASDPLNKYYFAVRIPGVETHTTIWAHGADARTYSPYQDVPTADGAACP